ncbi:hypothetical protein HpCHC82_00360 [Helicobacter pylori]
MVYKCKLYHALTGQYPSIIASSNISINIRVPSNFKFEINAFKLSEKCLAKNITYDFLLSLVSAGKNILISGGTVVVRLALLIL